MTESSLLSAPGSSEVVLDEAGKQNEDDLIHEGQTVIVYVGYQQSFAITVRRDATFQHRYGMLRHNDLINKRYGTKFNCTKGYVYVLRLNPELWTKTLPHHTQILYTKDISMIVFELDLRNGSVVAEAGVGSGSLSHSILRAVFPKGMLYAYDVDSCRLDSVQLDFDRHGFSSTTKLQQRDVCIDGFGLEQCVDAVFLDLPTPWLAVASAKKAMKNGVPCRFGSFSPCIEQVQQTCNTLRELGFLDIVTMDLCQRVLRVEEAVLDKPMGKDSSEHDQHGASELIVTADKQGMKVQKRKWTYLVPNQRQQPAHSGYLTFATKMK
uniref:tRNA (adenine(58)-N(1))-methyltransferase catalytic subunit TRMT61A n=1 Tax=Trichuris muris TaxID=70415 RepID=A0A5S6QYX1_TRIMR